MVAQGHARLCEPRRVGVRLDVDLRAEPAPRCLRGQARRATGNSTGRLQRTVQRLRADGDLGILPAALRGGRNLAQAFQPDRTAGRSDVTVQAAELQADAILDEHELAEKYRAAAAHGSSGNPHVLDPVAVA